MALSKKPRGRWWSRLHFLIRFLGLTGALAAGVGLVLAGAQGYLPPADRLFTGETLRTLPETARGPLGEMLQGQRGLLPQVTAWLVTAGTVAALIALLVEFVTFLIFASGRRGAFGSNVLIQVGLAAVLLVAVNLLSFQHYRRFDWTTGQRFTLPTNVQEQLRQLRGKTTILVFQRGEGRGGAGGSGRTDEYEAAARQKVIEKVKDLVDQFREFGPQFDVVVVNEKEVGHKDQLNRLTEDVEELRQALSEGDTDRVRRLLGEVAPQELADSKVLREALDTGDADRVRRLLGPRLARIKDGAKRLQEALDLAPEDTIFFYSKANGRVQSLSFNDFYQLDKKASRERDNLVLLNQGVERFANKVLNVEEKRPTVGICVIHEELTTHGQSSDLGLEGVRKVLTARGFEVKDIILKKWGFGPPEPGVLTYEESKLDRLEDELASVEDDIKGLDEDLKLLVESAKVWGTAKLEELNKRFAARFGRPVTEEDRENQKRFHAEAIAARRAVAAEAREERDKVRKQMAEVNTDAVAESRRMTDLKAKLDRALADCDLVIVPRFTLENVAKGFLIQPRLHKLNALQVAALRDYMARGKPLLACFGPLSERPEDAFGLERLGPPGPDGLEDLLSDLGIHLGKQTVLFTAEGRQSLEGLLGGAATEVPPVVFTWKPGAGRPLELRPRDQRPAGANRLRDSLRLAANATGKNLDLRLRHPRPVYFDPGKPLAPLAAAAFTAPLSAFPAGASAVVVSQAGGVVPTYDPEFVMTSADSWNADQPFPVRGRLPRYEPPKVDDPARGTLEVRRRGPFPIGVALETTPPLRWYFESGSRPPPVRVVAIGHGGWFCGRELSPDKERLLLDTCNWLLGREEHLPKDDTPWQYPRVGLSPMANSLWAIGTVAGLPLLFLWLGLVVVLVRRLR
ncbi:MAG TPA: hypothetical protein VFA26_22900 [Gemmataceae bacterium]|nr:hypothetical protein [Gemmataceae bacterium]